MPCLNTEITKRRLQGENIRNSLYNGFARSLAEFEQTVECYKDVEDTGAPVQNL